MIGQGLVSEEGACDATAEGSQGFSGMGQWQDAVMGMQVAVCLVTDGWTE